MTGKTIKLHKGLDWILGKIFSLEALSSPGKGSPVMSVVELLSPEVFPRPIGVGIWNMF